MYTVTDLGTLGGPTSVANAISENGIIVGGAEVPQRGNYPFVYQGNGPMQNLGLLDPVNGVTGNAGRSTRRGRSSVRRMPRSATEPTADTPFTIVAAGRSLTLEPLAANPAYAMGINDSGQIAGYAQTASGAVHGLLWTVGGATIDLGAGFLATAINNSGANRGGCRADPVCGHLQHFVRLGDQSRPIDWRHDKPSKRDEQRLRRRRCKHGNGTPPRVPIRHQNRRPDRPDKPGLAASWPCNAAGVNDLGQVVGGYANRQRRATARHLSIRKPAGCRISTT